MRHTKQIHQQDPQSAISDLKSSWARGGTAYAVVLETTLWEFKSLRAYHFFKDWGHSLSKDNCRKAAKAQASYTPAPAMVHLCKPAQCREAPFTDKTGGGNGDANVVERTLA